MGGFIAPGTDTGAKTIRNIKFFPDIDLVDARASMRLDGTVTNQRLTRAIIEGINSANRDLREWRLLQQQAGYEALADVPSDQIDEESDKTTLYCRAVYCIATANLTERYRSFDSTGQGNKKADELESPIDDLYRDARWAIRDIMDKPRTTVELI